MKWKKPITNLMVVIVVVFGTLAFIPGLPSIVTLFVVFLMPLGVGYLLETNICSNQSPIRSLLRLQSLLYPIGMTILALIVVIMTNDPDLIPYSQPMFWPIWSLFIFIWLGGSILYRYLHMELPVESADKFLVKSSAD